MDASAGVRLAAADTAWWHMESPVNQMTITAVLTLGARVETGAFRELLRTRLLPLHPFRCRLHQPRLGIGAARWVPDPAFDLDRHLHPAPLPPGADEGDLQSLASRLMSEPLDPALPPWHFHFVEDYAGGSAVVARLHHCIADGIALVHLLLTLDDLPGNEGPAHLLAAAGPPRVAVRALRPATAPAAARSLLRLVLLPPDPRSPLRGSLGMRKAAAWSPPFSLAEVRAAARALGCTLNDLFTAAAAGALRAYLGGAGRPRRRMRAVVPVNLRPPEAVGTLGNRFGLVFLALPVGIGDAMDRLFHVRREMNRLKHSCEAGVTYGLLRGFGPLGSLAVRLAVRFLGSKASLVFTDVPGPRETVSFCGAPLTRVMAWVPQSGRLGVGISVLSYAGQVQVGVTTDAGLVGDPSVLVREFQAALAELVARAPRPRPEAGPASGAGADPRAGESARGGAGGSRAAGAVR